MHRGSGNKKKKYMFFKELLRFWIGGGCGGGGCWGVGVGGRMKGGGKLTAPSGPIQ